MTKKANPFGEPEKFWAPWGKWKSFSFTEEVRYIEEKPNISLYVTLGIYILIVVPYCHISYAYIVLYSV